MTVEISLGKSLTGCIPLDQINRYTKYEISVYLNTDGFVFLKHIFSKSVLNRHVSVIFGLFWSYTDVFVATVVVCWMQLFKTVKIPSRNHP